MSPPLSLTRRRGWLVAPLSLLSAMALAQTDSEPFDRLVSEGSVLGECRGLAAEWGGGRLLITAPATPAEQPRYQWVVLPGPEPGWDLSSRASVEAEFTNTGRDPLDLLFWVVGDRPGDAVPAAATVAPGETRTLSCGLRETYPDKTPKIDPRRVRRIQVMRVGRAAGGASFELRDLRATGQAPPWNPPPGRLEVPPVEDAPPAPGRRVRFRPSGTEETDLYAILHLPEGWEAGKSFPVVAEFPGNLFFTPGCYSTGRPEQCVIGFGMTRGRGAICVGLPFVDPAGGTVAEHAWGDPDATADYAVRIIDEVCERYGGDRENLVLTGFSRGAIACGYIGLRNDRIASLWKGFHACQHYDGDGWQGATLEGALERAKRFRGRSVFQTDNSPREFQVVMDAMNAEVVWAQSGLGAHATAMFLDDRASTRRLRQWFADLTSTGRP